MNEEMWARANVIFPKIENGSLIIIGDNPSKIEIKINKHFNWFQKKMIKWCFGFDVTDYSGN